MNSIKGFGRLGSLQWDRNVIIDCDTKEDLIKYMHERFNIDLDASKPFDELMLKAVDLAEQYHGDNSGRTDT